jgi:hypothetical protein
MLPKIGKKKSKDKVTERFAEKQARKQAKGPSMPKWDKDPSYFWKEQTRSKRDGKNTK